jgi:hypothetical protein
MIGPVVRSCDLSGTSDDYPDECSRATGPECGYKIGLDNLIVDTEGTFIVPGEEMTNG